MTKRKMLNLYTCSYTYNTVLGLLDIKQNGVTLYICIPLESVDIQPYFGELLAKIWGLKIHFFEVSHENRLSRPPNYLSRYIKLTPKNRSMLV